MLSRCFLDLPVGVGAFVIGLSQISPFFFYNIILYYMKSFCHRGFSSSIKSFCDRLKMFLLCFIHTLAYQLISKLKDCQFFERLKEFNWLKF